jgi:hypothetical protein
VGLLVVDKAEEAPAADGNDGEGALGGTEGEVDDGEETLARAGLVEGLEERGAAGGEGETITAAPPPRC